MHAISRDDCLCYRVSPGYEVPRPSAAAGWTRQAGAQDDGTDMDITQLITHIALYAGVLLYALLAIVPLWLRHDAEREERPAESAGRTARHGRPLATPAGLDQQHRIGPRDALVH